MNCASVDPPRPARLVFPLAEQQARDVAVEHFDDNWHAELCGNRLDRNRQFAIRVFSSKPDGLGFGPSHGPKGSAPGRSAVGVMVSNPARRLGFLAAERVNTRSR